ncbi:unnamed protein product [Rhizophagus irregularis]|nr:unnamed protein product [Rhizophagus irregularis]
MNWSVPYIAYYEFYCDILEYRKIVIKDASANHPDNLALSDTKDETCRCNKLNIDFCVPVDQSFPLLKKKTYLHNR